MQISDIKANFNFSGLTRKV